MILKMFALWLKINNESIEIRKMTGFLSLFMDKSIRLNSAVERWDRPNRRWGYAPVDLLEKRSFIPNIHELSTGSLCLGGFIRLHPAKRTKQKAPNPHRALLFPKSMVSPLHPWLSQKGGVFCWCNPYVTPILSCWRIDGQVGGSKCHKTSRHTHHTTSATSSKALRNWTWKPNKLHKKWSKPL